MGNSAKSNQRNSCLAIIISLLFFCLNFGYGDETAKKLLLLVEDIRTPREAALCVRHSLASEIVGDFQRIVLKRLKLTTLFSEVDTLSILEIDSIRLLDLGERISFIKNKTNADLLLLIQINHSVFDLKYSGKFKIQFIYQLIDVIKDSVVSQNVTTAEKAPIKKRGFLGRVSHNISETKSRTWHDAIEELVIDLKLKGIKKDFHNPIFERFSNRRRIDFTDYRPIITYNRIFSKVATGFFCLTAIPPMPIFIPFYASTYFSVGSFSFQTSDYLHGRLTLNGVLVGALDGFFYSVYLVEKWKMGLEAIFLGPMFALAITTPTTLIGGLIFGNIVLEKEKNGIPFSKGGGFSNTIGLTYLPDTIFNYKFGVNSMARLYFPSGKIFASLFSYGFKENNFLSPFSYLESRHKYLIYFNSIGFCLKHRKPFQGHFIIELCGNVGFTREIEYGEFDSRLFVGVRLEYGLIIPSKNTLLYPFIRKEIYPNSLPIGFPKNSYEFGLGLYFQL